VSAATEGTALDSNNGFSSESQTKAGGLGAGTMLGTKQSVGAAMGLESEN